MTYMHIKSLSILNLTYPFRLNYLGKWSLEKVKKNEKFFSSFVSASDAEKSVASIHLNIKEKATPCQNKTLATVRPATFVHREKILRVSRTTVCPRYRRSPYTQLYCFFFFSLVKKIQLLLYGFQTPKQCKVDLSFCAYEFRSCYSQAQLNFRCPELLLIPLKEKITHKGTYLSVKL